MCRSTSPSFKNVANGVSGVIYPTRLLEAIKVAGRGFEGCCPKADDLWLHAQTIRAGFKILINSPPCAPLCNDSRHSGDGLWHENYRSGNGSAGKGHLYGN